MLTFLLIILSFLFPDAGFQNYQQDLFTLEDFGPHPEYVNELQARKEVEIHPGIKLPAEINVSSKGNGILTIGNISMHVFDTHDDSEMFRNKLLRIKLVDLDGDNHHDLVIFGIEDEYDEEQDDKWVGMRFMLYIYRYNPKSGKFDTLFATPEWRAPVSKPE